MDAIFQAGAVFTGIGALVCVVAAGAWFAIGSFSKDQKVRAAANQYLWQGIIALILLGAILYTFRLVLQYIATGNSDITFLYEGALNFVKFLFDIFLSESDIQIAPVQ